MLYRQIELDSLIRLRFATFKSEKRQPITPKSKKNKATYPITLADIILSDPNEPDPTGPPPKSPLLTPQGHTTLSLPFLEASLLPSPPPAEASVHTSPLSFRLRSRTATPTFWRSTSAYSLSEPNIVRLTALGDISSPGRRCSLQTSEA